MSFFESDAHADAFSNSKTIHQLFELQSEKTPEHVAVTIDHAKITYAELNMRSNQLAHHLRKLQVGPDTLVGVCVNRSLEMVIGLLGILKAGGAYVPLDPAYLKEQLAIALADAKPALVLTKQHLLSHLPAGHITPFCLDTQWQAVTKYPICNPGNLSKMDTLACVIYTNDASGKPKSLSLKIAALMKLITLQINSERYNNGDKSEISLLAPFNSDLPFPEIFLTLYPINSLVWRENTWNI
ncbi:MAG TPA: AMP-binding protein [Burkholderiaceae bacterium]|jgi:non-ribosomal peptide synthetase component F